MNPWQHSPKKDVIILLPYIGLRSNHINKRLKSCVNRFYSFVNVKSSISQNTRRIKSFFPYKDRLNRTQLSKVKVTITKLVAGTAMIYYTGKTKRRLHDRKTKHFKALSKSDHSSAIADHIKWDHFDILASGKMTTTVRLIHDQAELQPPLNASVSSVKLSSLY